MKTLYEPGREAIKGESKCDSVESAPVLQFIFGFEGRLKEEGAAFWASYKDNAEELADNDPSDTDADRYLKLLAFLSGETFKRYEGLQYQIDRSLAHLNAVRNVRTSDPPFPKTYNDLVKNGFFNRDGSLNLRKKFKWNYKSKQMTHVLRELQKTDEALLTPEDAITDLLDLILASSKEVGRFQDPVNDIPTRALKSRHIVRALFKRPKGFSWNQLNRGAHPKRAVRNYSVAHVILSSALKGIERGKKYASCDLELLKMLTGEPGEETIPVASRGELNMSEPHT